MKALWHSVHQERQDEEGSWLIWLEITVYGCLEALRTSDCIVAFVGSLSQLCRRL